LIRLHILAEGQTEETFVNQVLAPALGESGVFVDAHCITTGRRRGQVFRGGVVSYEHLARDLTLWMKQDQADESWFTTMIDLYRLPTNFPGRDSVVPHLSALQRVERLETELADDVGRRLSGLRVASRFIPYIQLHEFEALLFSDVTAFAEAFPSQQAVIPELVAIRNRFRSPEDIDDGPDTCPSKRILDIARTYQKSVAGPLITQRIGLTRIRRECAHFDAWVTRLIALSSA
jgi:hypothetical protein